jgi:signal transduction histidine kinase
VATVLSHSALREENRRLRALVSFGRQVTAERDLRAQLRLLAEEAKRATGCMAVAVLLRNPSRGDADGVETVGLSVELERAWRAAARSESGTELSLALGARRPAVFADLAEDHSLTAVRDVLLDAGVRCAVSVPLVVGDQLVGVMVTYDREPGDVAEEDVEYLTALAEQAALAIENARLYRELRDRLAEVTGLQAASAALVEELQPERALRVVAEQALALSGAATVSIELLRHGGHELEVQVAVGEHALELGAMRVPVDGSLPGAAVASGRPQIMRSPFRGAPDQGRMAAELADARSLLVLPLRAREKTLGTLSAYTRHPNAFHSGQVELLATFANQAAMSLDNARLYGELQSRLEEMVGLQRLGTLLLEEHDFDRVLQAICEQLQRLTDAGGVGLALLEDDPRYLEMRTVVGPSANALRGARIPTEGSFAAEALRTNRPQRSDDAQNDPRGYKQSLVLGNTHTILSVPMKTRQRTVGVLSIYNKQAEGGFTDRDADLATFFANSAAAAIENARLYERTREYAVVEERNRLARELHDSVTQSLFSVSLLSEAALSLLERDPSKARERLERANELAQGALAEMRALIFQLRPMTLQEEGLLSAIKKHLAALLSRHGRVVELKVTGSVRRLPAGVEEAAFRIVQESLNNVVKHANAPRAQVALHFEPRLLKLSTADNGVGFDPNARPRAHTMGMASMRERAESVGGRISVESAPARGTRVSVDLPIDDAE